MSTKLQWSLLMDVDLLLGTEQALMLHLVSVVCCLLLLFIVAFADEGVGHSPFIRSELDGSRVGHMLAK